MPAKKPRKPTTKKPPKTFIVMVREVHIQPVRVEAASKGMAMVRVAAGNGEILPGRLTFSHACKADTWTVEEENSPPVFHLHAVDNDS